MKDNVESSYDYTSVVGIVLSALFIFLFVWFIRSIPPPSEDDSPTPAEEARYEDYRSDQLLNENAEQEACIDQMDRDVERYGDGVADSYDCTN